LFAAFTSDGREVFLIGAKDGMIRYFDSHLDHEVKRVPWEDRFADVSVSSDRRRMASCGHKEPGVMLWDVDTGRKLTTFGSPRYFAHVSISGDGKVIVALHGLISDGISVWEYGRE
jgi:WD40 repeat protein